MAAAVLFAPHGKAEPPATTSDRANSVAQHDPSIAWWRDARFGMFIHWGLYSAAAGEWEGRRNGNIASWIAHEFRIPPQEYEQELKPKFTAERFEPAEWADLAKRAGMKYMVVTAKHHEGFCLWDSALTEYDSAAATAGRDLIDPLLNAFREEGLRVGVYYSMIDWHHPDYPVAGDELHPMRDDAEFKAQSRNLDRYLDYMHGQVKELLSNYGPIDILWWDFSYGRMSGDTWRSEELVKLAKSLQPDILMNNRLTALDSTFVSKDNRFGGDFQTPEQFVPPNGIPGLDWETCMTINTTWGYKAYDRDFKSSRQLIRTLIETASKGGNLLLNVGPRADGTIPEEFVERLEAMGAWLDVNGEAIYGTTASPFPRRPTWGRVTTGKSHNSKTPLYLHVFEWPEDGKLRVYPLENEVTGAYLLADEERERLTVESGAAGVVVHLPDNLPDADATVVVLEVSGIPVAAPFSIHPTNGGRFQLTAENADLHGSTIRCSTGDDGGQGSIGWWTVPGDWVSWSLTVPEAGAYRVKVTYGCDATGGGSYLVAVGDAELRAESRATGSWFDRVTDTIGTINLPAGETTLSLRIDELAGVAVFDVVGIELVPVEPPPTDQQSRSESAPWRNPLVKQGYLGSPLVEVTPLVFQNELYLMECWRSDWNWPDAPSATAGRNRELWMAKLPAGPEQYDRREYVSRVMAPFTLGTAIVWDDRVYVYAVSPHGGDGRKEVYMTSSSDMLAWSAPIKVFDSPQGRVFNVAVTRDDEGMAFLWETDGYGTPFTLCYGRVACPESGWAQGVIRGARYGEEKYTGGPALYYEHDWYYTLYLAETPAGWETRVTRSRDLQHWQDARHDRPFVAFDPSRRGLPLRPPQLAERNASDAELCYFNGRTIVYFTGSDQHIGGGGDLQWASYDGTPAQLLESFF